MLITSQPALDLSRLFAPRSVALVGASPNNETAQAMMRNLLDEDSGVRAYAVNPRYDEVAGGRCYPSLRELPEVPDCVVVAVNRDRVLPVLEEAAEIGVAAAVVFAIGFAEVGEEGVENQLRLQKIARESNMAILGPNCQGLINFADRALLFMDAVKPYDAGTLGLIAQSGSISTALINNTRGVAWRYAVSSGNEAVVQADDLLWHMVQDPECRGVCLFLESIRDPASFFGACEHARERGIPVIVLKTGRTEASARAAEAHSGALAAPDRLVDALFKRHGVIRVATLEEMLETAIALQVAKLPSGGRLATMTASGGQIEMVLEAADDAGLEHAELAGDTVKRLGAILPDFLDAKNPLDWWGIENEPVEYLELSRILAEDPGVDILIAVIDQTDWPTGEGRFARPYETALALAAEHDVLCVLLESVGGVPSGERVREALEADALLLSGFEHSLKALAHLVEFAGRDRTRRAAATAAGPDRAEVGTTSFSGGSALRLLDEFGIPTASYAESESREGVVAAAEELGYPVVVKVADAELTHKTEVGGVVVNLRSDAEVAAAAESLFGKGFKRLLVQPQISGVELILGVTRHDLLGSFLVVGLGGVWTEILGEVEIVPAGLAPGEALAILERMRGHELLHGARGTEPVDMSALVAAIEGLDAFAVSMGDAVDSVDVNPVIATPAGAWAVDALIVPRTNSM